MNGPRESISMPTTKVQIRYRVMGWDGVEWKLLFTSEIYANAEDFCWNFSGGMDLEIKKVWIRR